jgi:hypothetical protein
MGGRRAEYRDCPECAAFLAERPHHRPKRSKDPLRQRRWRPTDEWEHTTGAGAHLHGLHTSAEFRDCPDCLALVTRYPALRTHSRILGWGGAEAPATEQQRSRRDGAWHHVSMAGRRLHWRATTAVSQWPPVAPAPRPGEPVRLGLAHRIERCQCGPDWFERAIEVVPVTIDGRSYEVSQPPCEGRYRTRSDNVDLVREKLELVLHRRLVTEGNLFELVRERYPDDVVQELLWGKPSLGERLYQQTPALRSPLATYWVLRDVARLGLPVPPRCAGCRRRPAQWPKFRLPPRHLREAAEDLRWGFETKDGIFCSPRCLSRSDGRCAHVQTRRCAKPALPDEAYCARHVNFGLEEAAKRPLISVTA